jgi:hypothetical protein
MYIAAQEWVIGAVLLQEEDGKEFSVAYVSQHLLDAKTWYVFMEKLCLSLYYVCSKFRHYIISSSCIMACQYDVIKHILLDDTSIFTRTRGPLNIKDQAGRSAHKEVEANK